MSIKEPVKLDKLDKELLQLLQDKFPVEKRPWAVIGKGLGITEEEALSRSQRLFSDGIIRKLRTIPNVQKLGLCSSTLIAMKVPVYKMEEVVSIVNEYMSVTHNYQREHDYKPGYGDRKVKKADKQWSHQKAWYLGQPAKSRHCRKRGSGVEGASRTSRKHWEYALLL